MKPYTRSTTLFQLPAAAAFTALALAILPLNAQEAAPPSPPPSPAPAAQPAPAAEETVTLNPFEVTTDPDNSYGALNSRSITAFNTSLDHIPVSADIFDQTFMQDVDATTVEGLISNYSATAGNLGFTGTPSAGSQPFDARAQTYIQLRGAPTPNIQRDSLLFLGTPGSPGGTGLGMTSNWDLDRVEVIFGPQTMLYDGGGAGGVVNVVTKQAHFDTPTTGSDMFRVDQYGTKYNVVDYDFGTDNVAVRFSAVNAVDDTRRVNIGDTLTGQYLQIAGKLFNTTIRVSVEQAMDNWDTGLQTSLTSTGDPNFSQYNSYDLGYLVATNQDKGIVNSLLNWSNVNSLRGDFAQRYTLSDFAELEADTQWTSWLSTQLTTGIDDFLNYQPQYQGSVTFYSPGATANTLPGNWTFGMSSNYSENEVQRLFHGKALRFSALLTNTLFGGKAKSNTIVGGDYVGNKGSLDGYGYYEADSNWNVITNPALTATGGRTILPPLSWTVNNGPVTYPLFRPGAPRITWQGQNYVMQPLNPLVGSLITTLNPQGDSINGGAPDQRPVDINEGVYVSNTTSWLDEKLDTMFGFRLEHDDTYTENNGGLLNYMELVENHDFNFNAGADYHVLPWLAPYFSVSNSYLMPPSLGVDPSNKPFPQSQAFGEEVGVKLNNATGNVSGSVAYYHNQDTNEEFQLTAALLDDISPTGLNTRGNSSGYIADAESDGIQVTVTANPVPNWRIRVSAAYADGRIQTSSNYNQLYNDQFHENAAGDVTYADGTVVYVPATFNSKTPSYTAADAPAGSVPLTVTAMSTPSNAYYANPNLTSGAIGTGSNAAKVLESTDADAVAHGAILTGVTGLPITDLQLIPSLIPGLNIPGDIPVAVSGQSTTGYPKYALIVTSVYDFTSGWANGISVGGSVNLSWKNLSYYYYPAGFGSGVSDFSAIPFYTPTTVLFNPLIGYSHKFSRLTFHTQLNIMNVFNHYQVLIYPDPVDGYSVPSALTAAFNQQPRDYEWTNTIKF